MGSVIQNRRRRAGGERHPCDGDCAKRSHGAPYLPNGARSRDPVPIAGVPCPIVPKENLSSHERSPPPQATPPRTPAALPRLGRRTHPDFVARQQHQELWFKPYSGYPLPHLGRIAKAFWLGLDETAAVAAGSAPDPDSLLGKALLSAGKTFGYAVDVFGSEKLFTGGAASELLEPHWALNLTDSACAEAFAAAVSERLGDAVRERLGLLAVPFAEMADEDRQRVLERVPRR